MPNSFPFPSVDFKTIEFIYNEPVTGAPIFVQGCYMMEATTVVMDGKIIHKTTSNPSIDEESIITYCKGLPIEVTAHDMELIINEMYNHIIFNEFIKYS